MSDIKNFITAENSLFHKLIQVCTVVKDLDSAVENYRNIFGWEPASYETGRFSNIPKEVKLYYNKPEDFSCKAVFYKMQGFEIEMIQPENGKSTWADFLEKHGEGVHHVLFSVSDYAACKKRLESNGIMLAQQAPSLRYNNPECKWGLFDAVDKLGFYIEIFNPSEFGYELN